MRPVAFDEGLAAGTRLVPFSAEKPDRFFTVLNFGRIPSRRLPFSSKPVCPPTKSKTEKAGSICYSSCRLKTTNTGGVSGDRTFSTSILGRFLKELWRRSEELE
jgi:hypothetical protein